MTLEVTPYPLAAYNENYQRIANDHVTWWREHGANPFQDPRVLKANEDKTASLVFTFTPIGWTLLDVGCGMGDLMLRFPDRVCEGVDIADVYLEVASERGLTVNWATVEDLPYETGCIDTVVATDILEHVLDLNAAVRELVRVAKPGGYIIVRVPNMEPVAWLDEQNRGYQFVHLRIFDEGTLRVLFGKIFGCEVVYCGPDENSLHLVARKP